MWKQISIFLLEKKSFFAMDLIWGSEKIIKFGAARKKLNLVRI